MIKPTEFDLVEVGETFGPYPLLVDDHWMKSFAYALDDYSPWYFDRSPFGHPLAMSWAVAKEMLATFRIRYDPSGSAGLQQKNAITYHAPVPLGSVITIGGKFVDKFTRRGKGHTVLQSEARDADGQLLVSQLSTMIIQIPEHTILGEGSAELPSVRVDAIWPANIAPATSCSGTIAPGTPIPTVSKVVRQGQMSIFSAIAQHRVNVHNNREKAQRAGFPDCVAQGAMSVCWLSEMLVNFFGPRWLSSGWISVNFLKGTHPNDEITCRGVITETRDTSLGRELRLQVWTENQTGVRPTVGWASGLALR